MKKRVILVLLTLMLALVLCACGGETLTTAIVVTGQDTPQEQTTDTNSPEQEATVQGCEEDVPQEWKNALKSAENYSNFMYMSKQGIYDQLTSEYGDNFPAEAAQYAVENLTADYKANALEKAKTYYLDMAMSKQAVYDQLVSEYGEKFTSEEADYAIANLE
ncbi:MAG: Ltp family lipoprotein [Clostridiales bacterium]|nr:Ltp family lipoprotein [Clostridiales bacterium]